MQIVPQSISPVIVLQPKRFGDLRGYFSALYDRRLLAEFGIDYEFVQDNISLSTQPGTVRGLHFQAPPSEQRKLVSVLRGAVLDVVVDIRAGSPTFGKHTSIELSEENGLQVLVPRGFAHGFCTLARDTLVHYKVDGPYDASRDFGVRWNDPALGISWPVSEQDAIVSDKDRAQPLLSELPQYF